MADRRNKKAKTEEVEQQPAGGALDGQHKKLEAIQNEIEKLNDEATEEILQIEKKYNGLRKPYYKKRNDVIKEIPDFWLKAFLNHDMMADLLDEEDQSAFKYLKELQVEDSEDVKSGFKITFTFDSNPYFKNKALTKTFQYNDDGELTVIPSKIEWKEGMDLTKRTKGKEGNKRGAEDSESESFFNWFSEDDQDLELGEIIKEDMWPNPGKYYHGLAEDEEEGEEEVEVDDDEEGEEGEEAEGEEEEDEAQE